MSGTFADVYKFESPGRDAWAVKCFTREVQGLQARYKHIGAHLKQVKLSAMVDFEYLDQGIRVFGKWYPVLKMRWVDGLPLNQFVEQHVDRPDVLESLTQRWVSLAQTLRDARMAHADLQHGNVLLDPAADKTGALKLTLIDYDGMFVPALAKSPSGESGHPNFQHPARMQKGTYNSEVDRFPNLVICTALRCLKTGGRKLWEKFNNDENLLFKKGDFEAPGSSELFRHLWQLRDPTARALVAYLIIATRQDLGQEPMVCDLLGDGRELRPTADQEQQVTAILRSAPPHSRVSVKAPRVATISTPQVPITTAVRPVSSPPPTNSSPVPSWLQPPAVTTASTPSGPGLPSRVRSGLSHRTRMAIAAAGLVLLLLISLMVWTRFPFSSPPTTSATTTSPTIGAMVGKSAGEERDDNCLELKLCWCPPGSFTMGSPPGEPGRSSNEAQVSVTLSQGFWLGKTEVTVGQWRRLMWTRPWADLPPSVDRNSYKEPGLFQPATHITWEEAMTFCLRLTTLERSAGRLPDDWEYTLPTEAQWEYACRAGTTTAYCFGDDASDLDDYAWFEGNEDEYFTRARYPPCEIVKHHPWEVGKKRANAWGLHDMHGNLGEWCRDWYKDDRSGGTDPEVIAGRFNRVIRGGYWSCHASACRSARRSMRGASAYPSSFDRNYDVGFRVAAVQSARLPFSSPSPLSPSASER